MIDIFFFSFFTLLEILLQMGITNKFTVIYTTSKGRLLIACSLGVPYTIYCIILRCCVNCILKDGTILRKFRVWKMVRSIVCVAILFGIVIGRISLLIAWFYYGKEELLRCCGYTTKWFIIDNLNGISRWISGVYIFYGFKWITRALSQLKRSDEFDGERYDDNESKSDEGKKKEINQNIIKIEKKRRNQEIMLKNIAEADKRNIEEYRREKYGNFYDAYMNVLGQVGGDEEDFCKNPSDDVYVVPDDIDMRLEKIDYDESNSKYQIIF